MSESYDDQNSSVSPIYEKDTDVGVGADASSIPVVNNSLPQNTLAAEIERKSFLNKVADLYFEPNRLESEALYERLGIKTYRKYMPSSGDLVMRHISKRSGLNVGSTHEETVENLQNETRKLEQVHLGGLAVYAAASAELGLYSHTGAVLATAANVLINVYPIMLQRYNRLKANRIASRIKR